MRIHADFHARGVLASTLGALLRATAQPEALTQVSTRQHRTGAATSPTSSRGLSHKGGNRCAGLS